MTFLSLSLAAITMAAPPEDCSLASRPPSEQRVFTNADLDRMAACRYQTGAQSEVGTERPEKERGGSARRSARRATPNPEGIEALEANWRAQWRSIDQKTRRLRREARELRQEAQESPRGPKKQPAGRRSSSLLLERAKSLEAEAKELEDEFQERARREGALPGWLRPRSR